MLISKDGLEFDACIKPRLMKVSPVALAVAATAKAPIVGIPYGVGYAPFAVARARLEIMLRGFVHLAAAKVEADGLHLSGETQGGGKLTVRLVNLNDGGDVSWATRDALQRWAQTQRKRAQKLNVPRVERRAAKTREQIARLERRLSKWQYRADPPISEIVCDARVHRTDPTEWEDTNGREQVLRWYQEKPARRKLGAIAFEIATQVSPGSEWQAEHQLKTKGYKALEAAGYQVKRLSKIPKTKWRNRPTPGQYLRQLYRYVRTSESGFVEEKPYLVEREPSFDEADYLKRRKEELGEYLQKLYARRALESEIDGLRDRLTILQGKQ